MRTTIDLPDALYRQAKATSALEGLSLKQFVTRAIETALDSTSPSRPYRVELPLVRSRKPGSLRLTNAEIEDLLA
jgi:hypothetical protein